MLRVHVETAADAELSSTLDELVAEGARRMLAAALEAEVDAYVSSLRDERDEHGHRLVVRNGHAVPRSLVTGAGPLDLVVLLGQPIAIDLMVDDPGLVRVRRRLGAFCRTVWIEPRGLGASEGSDFMVDELFEADLTAVIDAVGSTKVTVLGASFVLAIASLSPPVRAVPPGSTTAPTLTRKNSGRLGDSPETPANKIIPQ